MLELQHGQFWENCSGFSRRSALKAGFLGALGLSSADLMRLRAEGKAARNNKSVILIWLDGGPSHMETYDPKPKAPKEYRGPWGHGHQCAGHSFFGNAPASGEARG